MIARVAICWAASKAGLIGRGSISIGSKSEIVIFISSWTAKSKSRGRRKENRTHSGRLLRVASGAAEYTSPLILDITQPKPTLCFINSHEHDDVLVIPYLLISVRNVRGYLSSSSKAPRTKHLTSKAANLGRTPAEIVSYSYVATFLDRLDNFPTPPQYGVEHVPPVKLLVPSGGDPDRQTLDLMFYDAANILKNDAQRAKAMIEGREVFLFYFRIIYKHVVGNTHPSIQNYETRMSFWYTPATRELHIGGPDEYNRHT